LVNTQHIIHKVFVEVNTNSSTKANDIRQDASSFVQEHILNHIEDYFEEIESEFGDKHIQLDSLEMTFDNRDITKVNSIELKSMVRKELDKTIDKIREAELVNSNDKSLQSEKLNQSQESLDSLLSASNEPNGLSVLGKKERAVQSIVHFLKTGTTPWWVPSNNEMIKLMDEKTIVRLIQEKAAFFIHLLKKEIRNARFVQRMIRQFSNEVLLLLFATQFYDKSIPFDRLKSIVKSDVNLPVLEQLSNKEKEIFWETVSMKFDQKKSIERIEAFYTEIRKITSINEELTERLVVFGLSIQSTPRLLVENSREMHEVLEKSVHSYLSDQVFNSEAELKDLFKQKNRSQAENKLKTGSEGDTDPESESSIQSKSDTESKLEDKADSDPDNNSDSSSEIESSEDREFDKEKKDESHEKKRKDQTDSSKDSNNENDLDIEKDSAAKKAIEDGLKSDKKKAEEAVSEYLNEKEGTPSERTGENEKEENSKGSSKNKEEEKTKIEKIAKVNFIAENAGLVLLHPFLKMFFANINLLNEKELTDPVRAAHYLHYAATGRESDYEFSMTFEKYLCGIPLTEPIEKDIEISDEIKASIDEMLLAVLGHWKALKTESIDLLRHEFLMREGKVIVDENSPRIIVERKTIDIMLDQLPWGLGIVGLPWKKELIYVEW
jgi:hypothetical protein